MFIKGDLVRKISGSNKGIKGEFIRYSVYNSQFAVVKFDNQWRLELVQIVLLEKVCPITDEMWEQEAWNKNID